MEKDELTSEFEPRKMDLGFLLYLVCVAIQLTWLIGHSWENGVRFFAGRRSREKKRNDWEKSTAKQQQQQEEKEPKGLAFQSS